MGNSIENIALMLKRFKNFEANKVDELIEYDIAIFDGLLSKYKILEKRLKKIDEEVAEHFNIFDIIKMSHYEALVHTPILTNLLNHKGTHAQGGLFFLQFLKTIFPNKNHLFVKLNLADLVIVDELFANENGFIDIFIHYRDNVNPFVIIIENKIYASDQANQITRYYQFAKSLKGITDENLFILYLKPQLAKPVETSIPQIEYERLTNNGVLKLISYEKHINEWLEECIELIKASVVKHTIQQYLGIIKKL